MYEYRATRFKQQVRLHLFIPPRESARHLEEHMKNGCEESTVKINRGGRNSQLDGVPVAYHCFIWSVGLFRGELLCEHVMLQVNRIGSKSSEASTTLIGFAFGAALLYRFITRGSRSRFWVLILWVLLSLFILILCGLCSVASS